MRPGFGSLRRGGRSACLLLFALTALAAPKQVRQQDSDQAALFYGIAQGNYLVGDAAGAEVAVGEALRRDPHHLPSLALQSRLHFDAGDSEAALASIESALAVDPGHFENRLIRAMILGHSGRTEEALADVRWVRDNAAVGSSEHLAAKKLLAVFNALEGNWEQAARGFQQYFEQDKSDPVVMRLAADAWAEQARQAREAGDLPGSLGVLDSALSQFDAGADNPAVRDAQTDLQILRAQTRARSGDVDGAIADLREVNIREPDNLEATLILASLYATSGQWEPLDRLIEPLATDPRMQDIALYLQGRAAYARGRIGTARARFEAALDTLAPDAASLRPALLFYRGCCLLQLGRIDEADTLISEAIDSGFRPESEADFILIAQAFLRADRIEEVLRYTSELALERSGNPQLFTLLGRAHERAAQQALALSAYSKALEIDATTLEARTRRAGLRRLIGDLAGAYDDYLICLELGDDPAHAYAAGLCALQIGAVEAAETHLGEAAAALTTHAAVQLLHALTADATGKPVSAQASLERYFAAAPERPSESAMLLRFRLQAADNRATALDALEDTLKARPIFAQDDLYELLFRYLNGEVDHETLLNSAGSGFSDRGARQQLCEIAYWMARDPREEAPARFLRIAIGSGQSDQIEFQLADWVLQQDPESGE